MTEGILAIAGAVALVAVAASIARYHAIAVIAVLVGGGVIVLGLYHDDVRQSPTGSSDTVRMGLHGSPVAWSTLYINGAAGSQPESALNVTTLSIMGRIDGDGEIKLDEAYFVCDLDGTRLNAQIGRGGVRYKIHDAGSLPPGALFFIVSDSLGPTDAGLSPGEFLKTWATISFVARYNGTTQKIEFDRQTVELALPKPAKP